MTTLSVQYRGPRGRFACVDAEELEHGLRTGLPTWSVVRSTVQVRGKKAELYGGGSRSCIMIRATQSITLPNGDVVFPQVMLRDQTLPGAAMTMQLGFFRQVCSNGLFAFKHIVAPIRVPHFKNRTQLFIYLVDQIVALTEQIPVLVDAVGKLNNTAIPLPMAYVQSLKLPAKVLKRVETIIASRSYRTEDNPHTLWGLYNIINEVDRQSARRGSFAYLDRDQNLLAA